MSALQECRVGELGHFCLSWSGIKLFFIKLRACLAFMLTLFYPGEVFMTP